MISKMFLIYGEMGTNVSLLSARKSSRVRKQPPKYRDHEMTPFGKGRKRGAQGVVDAVAGPSKRRGRKK
jgi:hypothetical protein